MNKRKKKKLRTDLINNISKIKLKENELLMFQFGEEMDVDQASSFMEYIKDSGISSAIGIYKGIVDVRKITKDDIY